MRKVTITTIFILFSVVLLKAQDTVYLKQQVKKNTTYTDRPPQAVFAELGGNGIVLSANYDRRFTKSTAGLGFRVGFGSSFGSDDVSFVTIPLGLNYLLGKRGHFFEVGLGETVLITNNNNSSYEIYNSDFYGQSSFLITAINIGYRRQPINGGFMFRAGVSPLFIKGNAALGAYFSFGYNF